MGTAAALATLGLAVYQPGGAGAADPRQGRKAPIRIGEDALHAHEGTPPGWRFTFPGGDAARGRQAFEKFECFKCHEVEGHGFPAMTREPGNVGPELTGMGEHHPAEYFAESILDPNAVIVTEPGYTGPDGRSIMPDYRDSLTVAELIHLVAFIKSLTAGGSGHMGGGYGESGAHQHGHGHQHGHDGHGPGVRPAH